VNLQAVPEPVRHERVVRQMHFTDLEAVIRVEAGQPPNGPTGSFRAIDIPLAALLESPGDALAARGSDHVVGDGEGESLVEAESRAGLGLGDGGEDEAAGGRGDHCG